jgi:signal peptidase II
VTPGSRAWSIASAIAILDLVSKAAIRHWLPTQTWRWGLFSLHLTTNSGVSFSLGSGSGSVVLIATIAITGGVALWMRAISGTVLSLPLSLIVGGGLGNIIDRIVAPRHVVTDFLNVHGWFVCNVADVALTLGVLLVLGQSVRGRR